jgi:glucan phosphoethanolaminetransferase (alkaline phosphatase superfamily)
MIQRIQTLFLALIAIAMISFLFVNIWDKKSISTDEQASFNALKIIYTRSGQVISETTTVWIAIMAILSFIVSVLSILSFRNRIRQMQFGLANSILIGAILGSIVYYSFQGEKLIMDTEKGSFGVGLLIPAIALICNSLANRFIRKDEEMVRSADRMR